MRRQTCLPVASGLLTSRSGHVFTKDPRLPTSSLQTQGVPDPFYRVLRRKRETGVEGVSDPSPSRGVLDGIEFQGDLWWCTSFSHSKGPEVRSPTVVGSRTRRSVEGSLETEGSQKSREGVGGSRLHSCLKPFPSLKMIL